MSLKNYVIYDIETAPHAKVRLRELAGEFDESSVKYGNAKDPEKRAAILKAAREDHENELYEKGALSATTGRVQVIGLMLDTGTFQFLEGAEEEQLLTFWELWKSSLDIPFIGYNNKPFDLPFIVRRTWLLGLLSAMPKDVMDGRYQNRKNLDLMEVWLCGERKSEHGSMKLDWLCKAAGLKGKSGTGKHFGELYAEDKKAAIEYLKNDLIATKELAQKLVVI